MLRIFRQQSLRPNAAVASKWLLRHVTSLNGSADSLSGSATRTMNTKTDKQRMMAEIARAALNSGGLQEFDSYQTSTSSASSSRPQYSQSRGSNTYSNASRYSNNNNNKGNNDDEDIPSFSKTSNNRRISSNGSNSNNAYRGAPSQREKAPSSFSSSSSSPSSSSSSSSSSYPPSRTGDRATGSAGSRDFSRERSDMRPSSPRFTGSNNSNEDRGRASHYDSSSSSSSSSFSSSASRGPPRHDSPRSFDRDRNFGSQRDIHRDSHRDGNRDSKYDSSRDSSQHGRGFPARETQGRDKWQPQQQSYQQGYHRTNSGSASQYRGYRGRYSSGSHGGSHSGGHSGGFQQQQRTFRPRRTVELYGTINRIGFHNGQLQ